jgi:RNA polymerase sigma-70 factor (ECF subfamily)
VLQPSALVNEGFVRLMRGTPGEWRDRTHFAFSSRLMRQILVDFARTLNAVKRGNDGPHLDLEVALEELGKLHERQARVVELRYFGAWRIPKWPRCWESRATQ